MAWDRDGTVAVISNVSSGGLIPSAGGPPALPFAAITVGQKQEANDEDVAGAISNGSNGAHLDVALIFPELREIDGIMDIWHRHSGGYWCYASPDTTNGIDGTFSIAIGGKTAPSVSSTTPTTDDHREQIQSAALTSQRCLRIAASGSGSSGQTWVSLHVYGTISPGETPDRLLWIDEITGLEFSLDIDYGDIPRGSARDRFARLKNNSGSLTANTIQITTEDLFLDAAAWYTYDIGGGGFASTRQISSLGAGATSSLITIRQDVPDAETLGLHTARAFANVDSWT